MNIMLGCKSWTNGTQFGFRVYADDIKNLVPILNYQSSDGQWPSLDVFYEQIIGGAKPKAFSRSAIVFDGSQSLEVTVTLAWHSGTVQGYITAPHGTWLRDYVASNLSHDLECEYVAQPKQDLIVIPSRGYTVRRDLVKVERSALTMVRRALKKRGWGPPPKAREIGLYFELLEYERLLQDFPTPRWTVHHRYPSIDSSTPVLRRNDVSCDIDVTRKRTPVRCVEVKSVSGAPGSPFCISVREWNSRSWCRSCRFEYQVVVYYHADFQLVQRIVIPKSAVLRHETSGYWCYPE